MLRTLFRSMRRPLRVMKSTQTLKASRTLNYRRLMANYPIKNRGSVSLKSQVVASRRTDAKNPRRIFQRILEISRRSSKMTTNANQLLRKTMQMMIRGWAKQKEQHELLRFIAMRRRMMIRKMKKNEKSKKFLVAINLSPPSWVNTWYNRRTTKFVRD